MNLRTVSFTEGQRERCQSQHFISCCQLEYWPPKVVFLLLASKEGGDYVFTHIHTRRSLKVVERLSWDRQTDWITLENKTEEKRSRSLTYRKMKHHGRHSRREWQSHWRAPAVYGPEWRRGISRSREKRACVIKASSESRCQRPTFYCSPRQYIKLTIAQLKLVPLSIAAEIACWSRRSSADQNNSLNLNMKRKNPFLGQLNAVFLHRR